MTLFKHLKKRTIKLEPYTNKNIISQEWNRNQDIFRWMKIKRSCQVYQKRIAKKNLSKQEENKRNLGASGRKEEHNKNVDKYNKFSSLEFPKLCLILGPKVIILLIWKTKVEGILRPLYHTQRRVKGCKRDKVFILLLSW